jgi:uncharacterized protein (TIGR01777 family)
VRFLLSGASGYLGGYLRTFLAEQGLEVARLVRTSSQGANEFSWDLAAGTIDARAFDGVDVVINLSGAGIADQRWSKAYKREILSSRVDSTALLARSIATLSTKPAFISFSAVGWYGHREPDEVLAEASSPGSGFMAEVAQAWEQAAHPAREAGVRVIHPRLGVVVGTGGMLEKLVPVFRSGIGGRLGNGKQVMSWVAQDDIGPALLHCLDRSLDGPVNLCSPQPVTNAEYTAALAHALHRPGVATVPAFALRAMVGEVATELLNGQRVLPQRLVEAGYAFQLPSLEAALQRYLPQL